MKFGAYILVAALVLAGCNEKSKVIDPSTLPQGSQGQAINDTTYIQVQPAWGGYVHPGSIIIGYDYLLYVTEPDSNRVQMVELSGTSVGRSGYIKSPRGIAEDRRFNLIITCEYDTTVNGQVYTVAAIAKIRLFNYDHDIAGAPVVIVHHEGIQNKIVRDAGGNLISGREYTGVAVLPDNSYYVERHGSNNSSPVDPDNMILHFNEADQQYPSTYINLVPALPPTGTGLTSINELSNITTFNTIQYGTDFIATQTDPANAFKVKWLTFNPGSELIAPAWNSKFSLDPTKYSSGKLPAIITPGTFTSPQAVMVDDRSNIFVVDSRLDSLMKFNSNGDLLHESFGPVKSSNALLDPSGITYFNHIVYISDTGHDRILRYELSTDIH